MQVTLAAAHQVSFADPVSLWNCLGVLQLASCLKRRGIPCRVADLEDFHRLFDADFADTMASVTDVLLTPAPDVLGFSTMSNNLAVVLELCRRAKGRNPGVLTVLGGPGVSFCAPEVLSAFPQVDAVIRGEADIAFPDFIEALARSRDMETFGVPGLVCRGANGIMDNGRPEPPGDLDALPIPAYEFCRSRNTGENNNDTGDYNGVSLEAGRGCPFNCSFCSTSHFFKRRHRLKSVARLMEEIEYIRERVGETRIIFHHDILTLRRDYIEELCAAIRDDAPGLSWKCHARFDTIDEPLLQTMRAAGCNEIFMGIESVTPQMQKVIRKQLDLSTFRETLLVLKKLDFRFSLSYIVGFPEEGTGDIRAIFNQALRAKALAGDHSFVKIHTLAPLVGADLFNQWKDRLVYDAYGSLGTSDIPVAWTALRDIIRRYPRIFSIYYHIDIGPGRREQACKFAIVGLAVDSLMRYSLQLAFHVLGEDLAKGLTAGVDQLELPPPASFKDTDFHVTTHSVRRLVLELLKDHPEAAERYDAVARFEIALQQVVRHRKTNHSQVIQVAHDPREVIEEIKNILAHEGRTAAPIDIIKGRRAARRAAFMILWDEENREVKCTEVPESFVTLP